MEKADMITIVLMVLIFIGIPLTIGLISKNSAIQCEEIALDERHIDADCQSYNNKCFCTEKIWETKHSYREGQYFTFKVEQ